MEYPKCWSTQPNLIAKPVTNLAIHSIHHDHAYLEVFLADGLASVERGEVDGDALLDGLVPDVRRQVARLLVLPLLLGAGVQVAAVGPSAPVALVVGVVVAEHDLDAPLNTKKNFDTGYYTSYTRSTYHNRLLKDNMGYVQRIKTAISQS